jgi:hypothetical protein
LSAAVLMFSCLAFLGCVFLATRYIVGHLVPEKLRPWAWLPLAATFAVLPFLDEIYNAQQTRMACSREGGMAFGKTIWAPSVAEGMTLIDTRRQDSEEPYFWKHELLFVYRPTGEELARLRWFERKHGWLQGNEPGAGLARYLNASPCPDPQRYLVRGAARASLVRAAAGDRPAGP